MSPRNASRSTSPDEGLAARPPRVSGDWQLVPAPHGPAAVAVEALDHSARLPRFIDAPDDVAERLGAIDVRVVGAGSVGMWAISTLSRMGIGSLRICDPGRTKPESLLTHPLAPDELGLPKAELAAVRAKALAPDTDVRFFDGPIQSMRRDALAGASVVFVATDNHAAEVAVSEACTHLGLPLVQASVYGPALVAQVRAIAPQAEGLGPCLVCSYTARDFQDLDAGTRFSCVGDPGAALSSAPELGANVTRSLPHLCAIAAHAGVGELLQRFLGLGAAAAGSRSLEYCGYHGGTSSAPLLFNPECPADHSRWSLRPVDTPLASLTPRAIARIAGLPDAGFSSLSFQLEGHRFAGLTACECPRHGRLGRFVPNASSLGPCPHCGIEEVVAHPLHTYSEVPGGVLAGCLDRTLDALGASAVPTALVRGAKGASLVCGPLDAARPRATQSQSSSPGAGNLPATPEVGTP